MLWNRKAQTLGILTVIAFGATVSTLALQTCFGRQPLLIMLGPVMASTGAATFVVWLRKRR
jgi:hypothetical protein